MLRGGIDDFKKENERRKPQDRLTQSKKRIVNRIKTIGEHHKAKRNQERKLKVNGEWKSEVIEMSHEKSN